MRRILVLLCLLLVGCAAPAPPAVPEGFDEISVGFLANGTPAGIGFVLEQGRLFEGQRIVAAAQRYATADALARALADGSIDIAVGLPALQAARIAGEGAPIVIAAAIQPPDERLIVPAAAKVQSVADLAGKTIGTTGGTADVLLATVVASRRVPLTETQLIQQLESGAIDAALVHTLTVAGLPDPTRYRVIADLGPAWQAAANQSAPPAVGTVAVRRSLAERDLGPRSLTAVLTAVRWGADHPSEIRDLMATHLKMTDRNARNYAANWQTLYRATLDDPTITATTAALTAYRDAGLIASVPPNLFAPDLYRMATAR